MFVVTGGAGFIGSNLVAGLEARAAGEIIVSDQLGQDDKWRNIAKRELADIVPPASLFACLDGLGRRVRAVFHLGAISDTTARDADRLVAENVQLTLRLWDWCAAHGTPFIHASSAATYGDGGAGFDDDGTIEGLAKLRPLNGYGWSKHLVDRRIARLLHTGAARPPQWAGLKFFNVYGPNEHHKAAQRSVARQLWEAASAGQPVRLFRSHRPDYPDGGQSRDFVWVGDCVDVMLWLVDNPGVSGLFNLGTGQARSFADLAGAVFQALNRPADIDYVDTPEAIRGHYQYFTEARMARLRAAGYDRPFTELEEGVRRYIQDFLGRDDPYR
ncbi:MAG: ADP-glyceromanno-heptose 6-epimerase [Alphaproteobacteria bacterium]|nr:ADP-glyceromanno-heptose 6-epimerase [Alphaproteobacteria bacterium]